MSDDDIDDDVPEREHIDYDAIYALSVELKRPTGTLIALSPTNDPFFMQPARRARAEWFAALWHKHFPNRLNIHLRAIHYVLVSQDPPVDMQDGTQYRNTGQHWAHLCTATRDARLLGLAPIEAFEDHRNDPPMVFLQEGGDEAAAVTVEQPDQIDVDLEPLETIESEPPVLIDEPISDVFTLGLSYPDPLDMPAEIDPPEQYETPEIDVPDPPAMTGSPPTVKPPYFHIEFWCEKTSANDVLMSVARPYGANVITGSGFASLTGCHKLIERAKRSGKPVRVLYISDFDNSGHRMPAAVSRTIEFLLHKEGEFLDVEIRQIALTEQQCLDYDLPRIPLKEKGRAAFEEQYGEGGVELDALEALHPGELRRILIEAIRPYLDPGFADRMAEAESDLETRLEEIVADVVAEHRQELDEFSAEYIDLIERRGAAADELGIDRTNALNAQIAAFAGDRIATMNATISGLRDQVTAINSQIRALVGPRVDAINAELRPVAEAAATLDAEIRARGEAGIAAINADLAALDERFGEAIQEAGDNFNAKQQVVAAALQTAAEPVLDEIEWPEPEEGETVEPLFDSKRDYLEQNEFYKEYLNKATTRKVRKDLGLSTKSKADQNRVFALHDAGSSVREISRKTGISDRSINNILKARSQ